MLQQLNKGLTAPDTGLAVPLQQPS